MSNFANPQEDTNVLRLVLAAGSATLPSVVFANDLTKGLSWTPNGITLSGLALAVNAGDAASKTYVDTAIANIPPPSVSFPLLATDGSTGAPSYAFASNPTYGWYLNSSNPSINLALNGSDQFVFSDGELDIITTAVDIATSNLHVEGFTSGKSAISTDELGGITLGNGSTSTSRTDGFPYIPTITGTPSGTPTTKTFFAPIVYDTGANKLWIWNGSAWKFVALS